MALLTRICTKRLIQSNVKMVYTTVDSFVEKNLPKFLEKNNNCKFWLIKNQIKWPMMLKRPQQYNHSSLRSIKLFCTSSNSPANEQKLSIYQRLKKLFKEYWYVTIPVHLVTSCGWFFGFYFIAKSGFDIVGWLEYINNSYFGFNEKYINHLKDSKLGYFAVAYALYKIFTPFRYMLTLGCTTISINALKSRGYIRPAKELYTSTKNELKQSYESTKKGLQSSANKFTIRKRNIADDIHRYQQEIKSIRKK